MNAKIQIPAEGPTSLRSQVNPRENTAGTPTATVDHTGQSTTIRTAGEILSDGSFIELIRNGTQASLLRWNNGETSVAGEVTCGDAQYTPTTASGLIQHLPVKPIGFGSTNALFAEVANFIERNTRLGSDEVADLAFFTLSSWFSDCLSISPSVFLFGAPLQAVSLLRVLGCICRHPVLSAGSSVCGLPPELRPTRLICQVDSRIFRQLPAIQFRGFGVIDPRPRQISGASVMYAGDAELKTPFAEACIQLWISPENRSFGLQDEDQQAPTINDLQNKLLMYRLNNYYQVKNSQFEVPEFAGASREYVRALGQCLVDAPELQTHLGTLFRSRDDAERTEGASQLDATVIEALIVCCHERRSSVHVSEIATLTNAIFGRNGEAIELSAKQVGKRMKKLGFQTTRLDSAGRGVYLLNEECARVHNLGRVLGVAHCVKVCRDVSCAMKRNDDCARHARCAHKKEFRMLKKSNSSNDPALLRRLLAAGCPMPLQIEQEALPDLAIKVSKHELTVAYDRSANSEYVFCVRVTNHSYARLETLKFRVDVPWKKPVFLLADPKPFSPATKVYRLESGRVFPRDEVLNHCVGDRYGIGPGESIEGVLLGFETFRRIPFDYLHGTIVPAEISVVDQFGRRHRSDIEVRVDRSATMPPQIRRPRGASLFADADAPRADFSLYEPRLGDSCDIWSALTK